MVTPTFILKRIESFAYSSTAVCMVKNKQRVSDKEIYNSMQFKVFGLGINE